MQPNRTTQRLLAMLLFAFALLGALGLMLQSTARAADPPNQPFDLIYEAKNVNYRGFQDGLGMLGKNEGTLNSVTLSGTQIVKAYLLWAGLGRDDSVTFARDAEPPVAITPDKVWNNDTFSDSTWGCCGFELSVYVADITDQQIVMTGTHSYTLGDMAVTHSDNGQPKEENWGYSLLVVYEDPALPQPRDIYVKLGNDGLFANWTGLIGPNSDVQCLAFDPVDLPRKANFNLVVGGVENEERPNALWGLSGNLPYLNRNVEGGTWNQNAGLIHLPPNIIGVDDAGGIEIDGPFDDSGTVLDPPFQDRNGDEWDEYQRFDVDIAPNDEWVCVQVESASQQNRPNLPSAGDLPNSGVPASIGFMGFIGIIDSPFEPAIVIEKATNGDDADNPTGPTLEVGQTVTWTYVVTNTGNVTLTDVAVIDDVIGAVTCPQDRLVVNESMTCTMTGTVTAGQYANMADVTGTSPDEREVTDNDPSHYIGVTPLIDIEKSTNGEDADTPTGPNIPVDAAVLWEYVVTNTGGVPLSNVTVTDDKIGAITCPQETLAVGESMSCTANGTAVAGQYANNSTVVGTSPAGQQVTDQDPSHYFGDGPGIDIEKATNGNDSDFPPGEEIPAGDSIVWTYVVTNIGNVPLLNVAVTDSIEGPITCPQNTLGIGRSMTCTLNGTAINTLYANNSTVVGTSPRGTQVTDQDPSHYKGVPSAIDDPTPPDNPPGDFQIFMPILQR